jgi:hypothetical protein
MVRKYRINGREICGFPERSYGNVDITLSEERFNQILEALNEEKEECNCYCHEDGDLKHCLQCEEETEAGCDHQYHISYNCTKCYPIQKELNLKCKHKNTGTCLACYNEAIEPKSTLREELDFLLSQKIYTVGSFGDKIISLFKDTLLKEINQYCADGFTSDDQSLVLKSEINKIIKNL